VLGFGNTLRGEDGFGVDVIAELQKHHLNGTKLISVFQLTPELALELKEFDEIIFVDAAHCEKHHYALACSLDSTEQNTLSHHISIQMILSILKSLYNSSPAHQVYSMLTDSYDTVTNQQKYNQNILKTAKFIKNL
jgi:hydrogenase maturation protease